MRSLPILLLLVLTPVFAQQPSAADAEARQRAQEERLHNDWAWLARYRDANAELAAPKASENRVVFMGDSITEGWVRRSPKFFEANPYVGRGISGQTTPQMLLRFQQDVVALHPKVVVINAGTNDIAGNTGPSSIEMIADNLKSMAQLATAAGIKVVLASITPAYDYPWRPGQVPASKIADVNRWMQGYCAGAGCVYADYYSAMTDEKGAMRDGLSSDGVHPNQDGYAIMEPIAQAAIARALSQ